MVLTTDLQERSKSSYKAMFNGIVSHGLSYWRSSGFSWPPAQKPTQNRFTHDLCTLKDILGIFIYTQTAVEADNILTWQITIILITEKLEDPNFSLVPGSKWLRLWDRPCNICGFWHVSKLQFNVGLWATKVTSVSYT